MSRIPVSVLVPWALTGCGSGLSDEDLGTVFGAATGISQDVSAEVVSEAATTGPAKDMTFEGDQAAWTLSGSITGKGVVWEGEIGVEGTGNYSPAEYAFDLALDYADVHAIEQDVTLNGLMDQRWSLASTGQTDFHSEYALAGDLEVSGSAEGSAEIDFRMTIDYSSSGYSYTYEGTINGKDVATMSGSGQGTR
jgi:hypothetical protein